MNSMAQQAVPKGYGHSEPFRAQLIRDAAVVVKKFSRSTGVASAVFINLFILARRKRDLCGPQNEKMGVKSAMRRNTSIHILFTAVMLVAGAGYVWSQFRNIQTIEVAVN